MRPRHVTWSARALLAGGAPGFRVLGLGWFHLAAFDLAASLRAHPVAAPPPRVHLLATTGLLFATVPAQLLLRCSPLSLHSIPCRCSCRRDLSCRLVAGVAPLLHACLHACCGGAVSVLVACHVSAASLLPPLLCLALAASCLRHSRCMPSVCMLPCVHVARGSFAEPGAMRALRACPHPTEFSTLHVFACVAPCVHLLAPMSTRAYNWLGCRTRATAEARSRHLTCQARASLSQFDVQNGLECGTCCAPVSIRAHLHAPAAPCAQLLAPARTRGCSWLGCSASKRWGRETAALHLPGHRQRWEQRSPRLSNDSAALAAQAPRFITSCALRELVRAADARNRLECGTCCAPTSTCAHVSARVAPCAQLLAPTRTRGCSWLGCGTGSAAAAPSRRFTS